VNINLLVLQAPKAIISKLGYLRSWGCVRNSDNFTKMTSAKKTYTKGAIYGVTFMYCKQLFVYTFNLKHDIDLCYKMCTVQSFKFDKKFIFWGGHKTFIH
jgi:hypothetical protein